MNGNVMENEMVDRLIAEQIDKMEGKSSREKFEEIRDRLDMTPKKKVNKTSRNRFITGIFATAASLFLVVGIGVGVYFANQSGTPPPGSTELTYNESDILVTDIQEEDFANPHINLSALSDKGFKIGEHKISRKSVYYRVTGKYLAESGASDVDFLYIIEPKYMPDDADYNTTNTVSIANKTVSYKETVFEDLTYLYKLGFKLDNRRYYIDYKTSEKDGYLPFLQDFIK